MKKSINILLAFLLLLSTIGVSVSRHYCGDTLKDSAFFAEANGCGGMNDMPMDCCHDETDHFDIQNEFRTTQHSFFQVQNYDYLDVFQTPYLKSISSVSNHKINLTQSPFPPLIEREIYLKIQSFLI